MAESSMPSTSQPSPPPTGSEGATDARQRLLAFADRLADQVASCADAQITADDIRAALTPAGSERAQIAADADETAWLIEETWSGFVHYVHRDFNCAEWAAENRRDAERNRIGLGSLNRVPLITKKIDEAMRFDTLAAAELWKACQPKWLADGDQFQIREHQWPSPSSIERDDHLTPTGSEQL